MEKSASFLVIVALAAATLLFPGCAQSSAPASDAGGSEAAFILPSSDVPYYARYTVDEGGPMTKEVWRAHDMMRMDLSSQGIRVLSFFFINSRAYSCSYISSPACYDVTATLSQSDAGRLLPDERSFASLMKVESVKIGDVAGSCYEAVSAGGGIRKTCFAPQGVMAFDSYNVSKTLTHTEYLTDIEYFEEGAGPAESIFVLPARPVAAPAAQAPPELQLEEQ